VALGIQAGSKRKHEGGLAASLALLLGRGSGPSPFHSWLKFDLALHAKQNGGRSATVVNAKKTGGLLDLGSPFPSGEYLLAFFAIDRSLVA